MASEVTMETMQEQITKLNVKVENVEKDIGIINKHLEGMQDTMIGFDKTLSSHSSQIEGALKRIDEQSKLTETVNELASSIKVLVVKTEGTDKKIDGTDKKIDKLTDVVDELKQKPAKRWEEITGKVLIVVITAVITFLLARFGIK